jgi:hypothetical protein
MIGYIYNADRKIVLKIPNMQKCNDTVLLGDEGLPNSNIRAIIGTGQYIVTDQEFNVGDVLPEGLIDLRAVIPVLTAQ